MNATTQDSQNGHEHEVGLTDITIGVIIGRTTEFFDFFVFAIAAVLVFPYHVFPFVPLPLGMLYSFAILALGFIARPIGTVIFTEIDRRYGRGTKMTAALFLLGTCTVLISFLPSYEKEGWLTVASLIVFRIGHGIAVGGSWDGMSSLLAKRAPQDRKGREAMVPQLGAPIGLILAASLFLFLTTSLTEEEFLQFGWRYPLFVVFATNVVALFARLRMSVSPEMTELMYGEDLKPQSPAKGLREEWRPIILGAFAPLAASALFHMVTVFPLAVTFIDDRSLVDTFLIIELFGAFFGIGAIMLSGLIADAIGRLTLLRYTAIGIGIFALIFPLVLNLGVLGAAIYVVVGFVLLGLAFGQSSGVVASGFRPENRYFASNITADLAWMFGAGFAPFVALFLTLSFGLWSAGLYLLSGAVCTYVVLTYFRKAQIHQNRSTQNA
ncbi:MFS transporter [Palleronia caenipelagi]|uniref:MHS family MFS transporter n=1 Tax=Palleronia caenipelagi TaxID=2489174 RepID=A0A547Q7N8_9RHOB|nr:MFS transporter [Palleronia caenipelagi]TRD22405.1 MHS family MFS transporter [Palleronia caenipelagi]